MSFSENELDGPRNRDLPRSTACVPADGAGKGEVEALLASCPRGRGEP
jgi:hypothetical protein